MVGTNRLRVGSYVKLQRGLIGTGLYGSCDSAAVNRWLRKAAVGG